MTVYNGYSASSGKAAGHEREKVVQPDQDQASATASSRPVEALPRQLPEGWEMRKSRSNGRVYFVNEKLGKSQFDPPAGSTVKAEPVRKKQRVPTHSKDLPDNQRTDKNGMMGVIRGGDKKVGRWQKWQQCSRLLQDEDEEKDA